jgi:hypothetical protein
MTQPIIAALSLSALLAASAVVGFLNGGTVDPRPDDPSEKKDRCTNGVSCLALSVICYGEYRCKETNSWGVCTRGECIPAKDRSY